MKHRKSVLSAAIVTCLGFAVQANAQEAAAPVAQTQQQQATELDGVTVIGIRGSLQRALETKRNADAIIDAVTAEDVGKFPASNVAEAIRIIPGVTIDQAFGQGEKVSILGTDPALNRTLLNGQTIASADWYIADQPGRTFNYSLLAPQIVGKVEVYKSPEAHIDEGSIGGTVIVSTRKPLDLDSKYTVSGQISYMYNDRIESGDPQASVLFGWKNDADNFGVIIAAQRANESIRRDGIESYGTVTGHNYAYGQGGGGSIYNRPTDWSVPANPDGSQPTLPPSCAGACATTLLANLDAVGPNSVSAHYFEQKRDRDTLSVALQFKPVEQLDIEFNALDVKAGFDNISHSMFAFNGNPWNSLMRLTDLTVEGGVITKASFDNALVVYDLINRQATVDTESYDLKATWSDERWFASAHAGSSKATGGTGRQVFGEFLNWSDYSYDISGNRGLTFEGTNPFLDPGAFRIDGGYASPWHTDPPGPDNWAAGWGGNIVTKPTRDEEKYGQVDFGVEFDAPIYQVRFGAKRREHETGQSMAGVALAAIQGYGDATASQFSPRPLPGNYLSGFSGTGDLSERFTIDGWALADWILSGEWLAPWQTMPEPGTFNDRSFAQNTWTVTEDISAAYVQADYSWNGFRGNVGFRYVQTESDSIGWQCLGTSCAAPADWEQTSVKKKYSNFLPNLNVAYDLGDDVVLRGSLAKVIARPNYGDMSNFLWLGPQTLTGGGGNPDLDPYESTNLDFSAEWYFNENSILAGSVFYRDVDNYILYTTREETHFNQSTNTDTVFTISRPDNAGTASVKGFSAAFQQTFDNGLGLIANYTYANGEADNGDPLPYSSKNQVNVSPFYENDRWSARVTYAWRSKYYTQVDRGNYLVTDDYDSLDASVGFRVNQFLSINLDGMNLLDSNYYTYAEVKGIANTEKLVRGDYRTGRRVMLSLRAQF
ncbi:TonB-dependent receptor [Pseudoxanthomonas suwonensis]|uniref:TonB-dependent receptor n=1 Tax=Pseudoxanthomonas suwonensis TaxID=314722 RepID=A0A0E3UN03_9GAMM|nr:TonB-dependent receptor [Pseudoxanthomonas suwonensis]AKC86520.1 TonB-dependent receptor [Pseudoxanthomonas suwonensis]